MHLEPASCVGAKARPVRLYPGLSPTQKRPRQPGVVGKTNPDMTSHVEPVHLELALCVGASPTQTRTLGHVHLGPAGAPGACRCIWGLSSCGRHVRTWPARPPICVPPIVLPIPCSHPPIRFRKLPAPIRVPIWGRGPHMQPCGPQLRSACPQLRSAYHHPARAFPFSRREPQTFLFEGKETL